MKSLAKIFCFSAVLLSLTLSATPVYAVSGVYECDKILWRSRKPVKWNNTTITFRVDDSIWNNTHRRTELEQAVANWNTASIGNVKIQIYRENGSSMISGNNVSEIYMAPLAGTTIGLAQLRWGSSKLDNGRCYFKEVDISFDTGTTWDNIPEFGDQRQPLNFGLVAVHELGHALGQRHDSTRQRSMNDEYPNGGPIGQNHHESPFGADRAKLREVYGDGSARTMLAASRWERDALDPKSAKIIDLLRSDRSTSTNGSVSRGQKVFFPYSIHNLGTVTNDLQVKFYMSNDRVMGNSGDILMGESWYTLPGGTDLTAQKYLTIPSSRSGFQYFGYKVTPRNGDNANDNEASLYRHYWVN